MKQREDILVRKRVKTNNEFRLHDAPLDIFQVHNEEGESLGDILTELREDIKMLKSLLENSIKHEKDTRLKFIKAFKGGQNEKTIED